MSSNAQRLLQLALPLVRDHGFSKEVLSYSVLSLPEPPSAPLNDAAVNALFGKGDNARRTLINAWLEEGRVQMRSQNTKSVGEVLAARLRYNEPVLPLLPEVFALLASPRSGLPPLDARPALQHATSIANEACQVVGDASIGYDWYTRRASLAAVYAAAELHQLSSPETAPAFLHSLLTTSASVEHAVSEVELYADYILKSWKGIIRSSGVF
ncbi:unnamed protein product [Peniophora sp. CBMAI 1063]|nr:unnamed protein product [Peniophora sp. CBMAI 1063]